MILNENLDDFLDDWISVQSEYQETSAYIKSTMKKYIKTENSPINKSIVLMYSDASTSLEFEKFQQIGDWAFFTRVCFPESIKCEKSLYDGLGRNSYYKCYRLLRRKWPLYKELADRFDYFIDQLQLGPNLYP